jgi:type IV pilus assembly protein PilB
MRIPDALAIELLKRHSDISDHDVDELYEEAHRVHRPIQDLIVKHGLMSEQELSKLYAEKLEMPYIELSQHLVKRDHLDHLGERLSKKYRVAVFDVVDGDVKLVALEDPGDSGLRDMLKKEFGDNVRLHVTSPRSMQDILSNYRSDVNLLYSLPDGEEQPEAKPRSGIISPSTSIGQTITSILEYAVRAQASDVHIEPRENLIAVRFRVNGKLVEIAKLPIRFQDDLTTEFKKLAKGSQTDEAVFVGKFGFEYSGQSFSVKLTGLPVIDGEKIVLHLVNELGSLPTLEQLGLWGIGLKDTEQALSQSQGLILVVGGKSSGKSTSLLTLTSTLKAAGQSVSTVEEDISTKLAGVNQTEVGRLNRLSIIDGLKAVLAQDADIIMVDEMHDEAAIDLAVQASNSGRLIMGSFNASSAVHAVTRLSSMGIRPYLSAAALKLIVHEKLARRLCQNCREAYRPDTVSLKQIAKEFSIGPRGFKHLHEIETIATKEGLGKDLSDPEFSSTSTSIKRLFRARKNGCEKCHHSGYSGRVGLFEILIVSEAIQKMIASGVSEQSMQAQAVKEGMVESKLDGLVKALRGLTTIEEVL